jgi:bacterioferritin-associated ferredoxin
MSDISNNPLAKHFRQPALYINLTSGGKYWKNGSLELPATGGIPVFPMTTKDEITLRTPDALVNGTSVVEVIQSCVPNIKNAWEMPSVDVDSTLIAIRLASYGKYMGIKSKCPKCNEEHDYDIDLNNVLEGISMPDYSQPVKLQNLTVVLKPMTYSQVSQAGTIGLEEEKLIQALANPEIDDEVRKLEYDKHINKMIDLNIDNVVSCTDFIATEDGERVTNSDHIREFYRNADATVMRTIQNKIKELAESVAIKPMDATCDSCGNEFKLAIEFDYASFFGQGF